MSHPSSRFVVLHHTGFGPPHFDFLFEWEPGEPLTSFRCEAWPPNVGDRWQERPEHRRVYLDYEGPVSGGRGEVRQVAAGTIQISPLTSDPPTLAIALDGTVGGDLSLVITNLLQPGGASLTDWIVDQIDQ